MSEDTKDTRVRPQQPSRDPLPTNPPANIREQGTVETERSLQGQSELKSCKDPATPAPGGSAQTEQHCLREHNPGGVEEVPALDALDDQDRESYWKQQDEEYFLLDILEARGMQGGGDDVNDVDSGIEYLLSS
ncbi:unnamed protein product [Parascedosporium putredinis]|uniref:Uncharacterized protein n=1 Tax=Parascedosporium putredinis TaxID=1442378 RepID=A0A9P1M816_9PEZI|nr:unnamed protein product [Parascedosporium putredinis]CAI7989318.1 unnamed protein product [Parascedosporium putredinis]